MAHSKHTGRERTRGERVLRAQLAIEPHPESSCAVASQGVDAQDVSQHVKLHGSDDDCGECHAELSFGPDDDRGHTYLKSAVQTHCICPVFEEHDCIPRIEGVRNGRIIVRVTVPRRELLREILTDLAAVEATVTVQWLVDGGSTDSLTEIDTSSITDKQHDALNLAKKMGYYEQPRETDLGDLADELDISKSAVSQRLNAAETKLVRAFLDE